jgi:hypothetical protein
MNLLDTPDPTWAEVEEFSESWELDGDVFMVVRVLNKEAGTLNERAFTRVRDAVNYVNGFDSDLFEVTYYNHKEMFTTITQ